MDRQRTYAEVAEGVRATIATYTQALDDGRTDDVVATFCAEGICELPGMGTHPGPRTRFGRPMPSGSPGAPQRHLVVNTVVSEWTDYEAEASSDFVFMLLGDAGWTIQLVGRYHDILHFDDGLWRFQRRAATFVTEQAPINGTA